MCEMCTTARWEARAAEDRAGAEIERAAEKDRQLAVMRDNYRRLVERVAEHLETWGQSKAAEMVRADFNGQKAARPQP